MRVWAGEPKPADPLADSAKVGYVTRSLASRRRNARFADARPTHHPNKHAVEDVRQHCLRRDTHFERRSTTCAVADQGGKRRCPDVPRDTPFERRQPPVPLLESEHLL